MSRLTCSICRKTMPDFNVAARRLEPSEGECQCQHTRLAIEARRPPSGRDGAIRKKP